MLRLGFLTLTVVIVGCASKNPPPLHPTTPAAAVIFREPPPDIPHTIDDLQLFEHPLAHVYARSEAEARDAIRWMIVQRRAFMLWFPDVASRQVTMHVNDGEPLWYSDTQPKSYPPRFDGPLTILTAGALEALGAKHADRVAADVDSSEHDPIADALGRALTAGIVAAVTEEFQRVALWQAWLDDFKFTVAVSRDASPEAVDLARALLAGHVVSAARSSEADMLAGMDRPFDPEHMPLSMPENEAASRLAWEEYQHRFKTMHCVNAAPTRMTYVRD